MEKIFNASVDSTKLLLVEGKEKLRVKIVLTLDKKDYLDLVKLTELHEFGVQFCKKQGGN